jgi:hypothetical protein
VKNYRFKPMHKKVNRAMFTQHVMTIDKEYEQDICSRSSIKKKSMSKTIIWDKKEYDARLGRAKGYYQLDWGKDKELIDKFNKTFIQSYAISAIPPKYQRRSSRLRPQEVLCVRPLNTERIEFKTFIRIEDNWNQLLSKLVDENVFGWIFRDTKKKTLITKSSRWYNVKDFNHHADKVNVIYYLFHTRKRLLYIGKSSSAMGSRVKPKKAHQGMPAGWDMFKYDIIKHEYSGFLELIEDHTIRAFASVLLNYKNYPTISSVETKKPYTLVNSQWKKIL